ncbi:MAG TPA: hypothetical protein VKE93_18900 [Candidatus Angelobacter sp.]|nr:hypothetical protein [Candidatus Angelobacter sp.]
MARAAQHRVKHRPAHEDPAQPRDVGQTSALVRFFRKPGAQRALVVLVLAVALAVQYRLVNIPVSELKDTQRFTPAYINAAEDSISFVDPETEPGQFSFRYEQAPGQPMIINAYFDNAVLSAETLKQLANLGVQAPSGPNSISYLTNPQGTACSTNFAVETIRRNGKGASEVQFFQAEQAPSERHRLVESKIDGIDSTVRIVSAGATTAGQLAQCGVTLQVGNWKAPALQGFLPITVEVPAGSSFRFRWEAADVKAAGWPTEGDVVSLLTFGNERLDGFHARGIEIRPLQANAGASKNTGLSARCADPQSPFKIDYVRLARNRLEISADGRGRATEDGKVISKTDFLARISQYPLLALLVGGIDAALVGWARRAFFGKSSDNDNA